MHSIGEALGTRVSPAPQVRAWSRSRVSVLCGFLGFDDDGKPRIAEPGWPVFRYGLAKLEDKKLADGEPVTASLTDWALKHRFQQPGSHLPFADYTYAEQATAHEVVP